MYVDSNTINNKFTEPTVYFWRGSRIIFDHTPHQIAIQRRSLYGTVNCKQRVIPLHLHTLTIFLFYLFFLSIFVCCLSKQKKLNCMNEGICRVSLCGLASDLFQNGSRGWLPILLSIVFLMFNGKGAKRRWGGGVVLGEWTDGRVCQACRKDVQLCLVCGERKCRLRWWPPNFDKKPVFWLKRRVENVSFISMLRKAHPIDRDAFILCVCVLFRLWRVHKFIPYQRLTLNWIKSLVYCE